MAMVSSTSARRPARAGTAVPARVLFDVLFVFIERGGADGAQFAARERGLQHVGGIHRAFRSAGADKSVQLIDKQDDLAFGFRRFP